MIRSFFAGILLLGISARAQADVASAVSVSSGAIIVSMQGYQVQQDINTQNFDLRWLSYYSRILAILGEFQVGIASQYKVTQIMETRIGAQYYPLAFGADFEDLHDSSVLRYSASFKPYVNTKFGWGRYFVKAVDAVASAEVSANYFSVGAGLGTHYQLFRNFALDANVDASFALGTSVIQFSGLMIRPRFGVLLYL